MDAVRFLDLNVREAGPAQLTGVVLAGQRPGDAACPLLHALARFLVHALVGDDVADGEATARPQDSGRLAEDAGLVGAQIDDAVGDDHVDRVVGKRDVLDRALDEFDVLDPGLALVLPRQLEHLVGHVEAIGHSPGPDPASRQQHVDPAAGPQIQDGLTLMQRCDRGRVPAAEARQLGCLGQGVAVVGVIEARAEELLLFMRDHRGVAATGGRPRRSRLGRGGIATLDSLAQRAGILGHGLGASGAAARSGLVVRATAAALGLGFAAGLLRRRRAAARRGGRL